MTVWVFGDSFAHHVPLIEEYSHPYKTWPSQLAERLNQPLMCFGCSGSALDYTYHCFNKIRYDIKRNDTVVITLTEIDRKWFWKDRPQDGSVYNLTLNKEEAKAYKYYELYLNKNDLSENHLQTFLHDVDGWTKRFRLNTIIMSCFTPISETVNKYRENLRSVKIARGDLFTVSRNEFKPSLIKQFPTLTPLYRRDRRQNHLIKSNHDILVNKILDNELDLTKGFITDIIDIESYSDITFSTKEFFSMHKVDFIWSAPLE